MCLDYARPGTPHRVLAVGLVATPLQASVWEVLLQDHPDKAFTHYICKGIQEGFRIGFQRSNPLRSATANMPSAAAHPEVVSRYIDNELVLGRMLGPFPSDWAPPGLQISRFGVIPKGQEPGKWRLITDLSSPHGYSVNDGIEGAICSLTYTTVDTVADAAYRLGTGSLMGKFDVEAAYRQIPVHPQDRLLQAVQWEGNIYVDPRLPFGLRSAPKIFNAVADALQWILQQAGINCLFHYLDDFIMLGAPGTEECREAMTIVEHICKALGVPLKAQKTEGPTTLIKFLGIVIDTIKGILLLPADKLNKLQDLLREWGDRRSCTRKELESLIGHLNHAAKVVRSGRAFFRRMLDLLHSSAHRAPNVPIRLNTGFRNDLAWWMEFVAAWNGISFLPPPELLPQVEMASDASGAWGCGAWHGTSWFQVQWDERSQDLLIAAKELIPIILSCAAWGERWAGQQVTCHCDNQVVVACLRSRSSRNPMLMHLIRCLVFIEAHFGCYLQPIYINTRANHLADDLSRNHLSSFLSKVPEAAQQPTPVSGLLLELLLDQQADWICRQWRNQFRDIFRPASPQLQGRHTGRQ